MKNKYLFEKITFISIYGVLVLITLILVLTKFYGEALFVGFPGIVLFPIYLTFYFQNKERKSYVKSMLFCSVIRFILILAGIIIPACIWNYNSWIKESTNGYMMIIPAAEILFVYTLVMIHFTKLGKQSGENNK